MTDWTGGLINRPDVPISLMRLPAMVHRLQDDEALSEYVPLGRRPQTLMAQVKQLVGRHGRISTQQLQVLLPDHPARAVAVATRNLARMEELQRVGRVERTGPRGSACAIWEVSNDNRRAA